MKRVLVIGLGSFGLHLAAALERLRCEVVAMDIRPERIAAVKPLVTHTILGNATDKKLLFDHGVQFFDRVCVCLSGDIAASILLVSSLKEAGVKQILAKACSEDHAKVLGLVGATEIIFPEKDEAERLASEIALSENFHLKLV